MDIKEREAISALADGEAPENTTQALLTRVLNDSQSRELYLAHRRVGDLIRAAHKGAGAAGGQIGDAVMLQVQREPPLAVSPTREQTPTATVVDLPRGERRRERRPFAMAATLLLAAGLGFFFARQIPAPNQTGSLVALPVPTPVPAPVSAPVSPLIVADQSTPDQIAPDQIAPDQIAPVIVTAAASVPIPSASLAEASSTTKTSSPSVRRVGWDTQDPSVQRRLQGYLVSHSEYLGRGMRGMHPYARVVAYAGAQQ